MINGKGKLLIKGVLHPEDANIAADIGLDGLFVSNHGGRQLDSAISPLKALPAIAAEKRHMAILFDGGIRRGTDVVKAIALAQTSFLSDGHFSMRLLSENKQGSPTQSSC